MAARGGSACSSRSWRRIHPARRSDLPHAYVRPPATTRERSLRNWRRQRATILLFETARRNDVVSKAGSSGRNWHSVMSGVTWGLSTLAFVIAVCACLYATVVQVDRLTRVNAPKPPEVASDVIVRNAKDQQGRRASFRVLLFRDEFRCRIVVVRTAGERSRGADVHTGDESRSRQVRKTGQRPDTKCLERQKVARSAGLANEGEARLRRWSAAERPEDRAVGRPGGGADADVVVAIGLEQRRVE